MFNSYGIYNYFNQNSNSIINEKLSNNDNPPLLEDLLIEEDIIDELQNKNFKLINYLNKEKMKQMLDYIIKEPKDADHNKAYKFPFVVSKLFNVEETNIMKYFFKTNKELKEENKEKNNLDKINDIYFDLNQGDENNDIKDKEINIDDINVISNDVDNADNCNYNYDELNKENKDYENNDDEVNLEENKGNENNDDKVNLEENKDNKDNNYEVNLENNNKENEVNNKNDNEEENKEKKENDKKNNKEGEKEEINKVEEIKNTNNTEKNEQNNNNSDICLFKSSYMNENNKISKNQRYEKSQIKEKKENKNEEIIQKLETDDKYPEDKIEILDYFFSFLIDDSELNYVLCGYFSSLMSNLLNIDSIKIIKYLFLERKDILKRLVYHSYRKSISETLCKIIKYEDKFNQQNTEIKEDYDEKEFSKIRLDIIKDIFDKIDINMDSEKLYSISYIINDLSENKKILESILNDKNIILHLINKQLKDLNLNSNENEKDEILFFNKKYNFIIIVDIIINWLNSIKNFDMQIPMIFYEITDELEEEDLVKQKEKENNETQEILHTNLSQALFDILPNLIQNNFNPKKNSDNINNDNNCLIIQSYTENKLKPFGLYRIKIVEILTNLITYCKNIPNEYDNILLNSKFLENSINYIFEYEWNNLYQEAIFQFLKKLLTYEEDYPYHELSLNHLFTKINILNEIIIHLTSIKNKSNNEGNTGNGYTALLISLSYKINTIIGGNYVDLNKSYTREGSITFTNRGQNLNDKIMDMINNFTNINIINKTENNEKDKNKEIKSVECMKKYCSEEWNNFFKENISNIIKIYEEKLCDKKNTNISFGDSKDDLFASNFDNENYKNDNNEEEDLLGKYKSRDEELFEDNNNDKDNDNEDDLVNNDYDSNKVNKKGENLAKYKDMEINLNDFNFVVDNEDKKNKHVNDNNILNDINDGNINDKNDKKEINNNESNKDCINNENNVDKKNIEEKQEIDNTYNWVNFWKKSLEKETNSYLNNIGEEAMNDLLE